MTLGLVVSPMKRGEDMSVYEPISASFESNVKGSKPPALVG